MARVGVISDTHGLLRPEALRALAGADLIVHAGDVGDPRVLEGLRAVAPVVAVRGNNDRGPWAAALAETEVVASGGRSLYVLHDLHGIEEAMGDRVAPGGARRGTSSWDRVLERVFLIALERGFLDSMLDRLVVAPFNRVARLLTRLDEWLCGAVSAAPGTSGDRGGRSR